MATETSNIDDLLMGGVTSQIPATPESIDEREETGVSDYEIQEASTDRIDDFEETIAESETQDTDADSESRDVKENKEESDVDDYGNQKARDNDVIRERLARQAESMKRQHQAELDALRAQLTPQQQQATEGFQYDENSTQSWDQQLRQFVEHTVQGMSQRQQQEAERFREMQATREFEMKFSEDMNRFHDFKEVVTSVGAPITDPMVHATRGMKNPAAFLYAAAKRAPQELQRISNIQDPYVQVSEMGRLEASLRQTKPGTKAPRPIGKSQEDSSIPHKTSPRELTIEEQIKQADNRKLAQRNARRAR